MAGRSAPWWLLTLAGLAVAAAGMAATFEGPFTRGWLGANAARYAQIARNYDRVGLLASAGAPRRDAGLPDPEHPDVYAHHPPALAMAISLAGRVIDDRETAARIVPALATLIMLLFLARLVRVESGPETAALAVLVTAAQPMVSVFGAHVDVQGAPVLCASLGVLLAYRRWLGGGRAWAFVATAVLAAAFDWYGLYAPVLCAAHLVVTRRRWGAAAAMAGLALALFAFWLAWLLALPGMSLERLGAAARVRTLAAMADGGGQIGPALSGWLASTSTLMPGWPLLLLVALAVLLGGLGLRSRGAPNATGRVADSGPLGERGLLALLLLPPLLHGALFPAGMLQHGYWLFGLPPALGLGFAIASRRLRPAFAVAAALLLLVPGWVGARSLLAPGDELPVLLGRKLAESVAPGEAVLTNYDCNPFVAIEDAHLAPGGGADAYLLHHPALTYYSDRVVRGRVRTAQEFEAGRRRRDDFRWFLETPWPEPAGADLRAAIAAAAEGQPLELWADPPVLLHRLAP